MPEPESSKLEIKDKLPVEMRVEESLPGLEENSFGANNLSLVSIDDRYQIEAQIGAGGMGAVYKAKHLLLNRSMAIKVLNPQAVASPKAITRFQQEAKAATALNHEHIASVKEFGVTKEGLPFLAMDYIKGSSLADVFKGGPLDAGRTIDIFMQLCEGMAHAHKRGILHRDLKPANILLAQEENRTDFVKIVDFGIAKILPQSDEESVKLTQTGELFGTPLYMSPEQWDGGAVDARTDVYAMGCVMYEAATGKPPFDGASVASIIYSQLREAPKPFAIRSQDSKKMVQKKMLVGLENVTLRCLEKDPNLRYQSMEEVYEALKLVRDGGTAKAGASQSTRRRRNLFRFVVVSFISILIFIPCYFIFPAMKNILFPSIWSKTLAEARTQMGISAWETAEAQLMRALKQAEDGHASASDLHTIWYEFGQVYINTQQYANAVKAFENSLHYCDGSIDPLDKANTLEELAMCLRAQHIHLNGQDNSESAKDDYKKSLKYALESLKLKETNAGPDHPYVSYTLDILAPTYLSLGDAANAEAAWRRAIKIDEGSAETRPRAEKHWEALAQGFIAQGKKDEAADCLRHALDMSKDIYGANSEKAKRLEGKLKTLSE